MPSTSSSGSTACKPEDPATPDGQQYGYGITYQRFGPNASMYYHGGELPGFNSFMGYDPDNDVTLVIWTNLTLSPEGKTTAQALLPTVLDEIYAGCHWRPHQPRPPPGKAVRGVITAAIGCSTGNAAKWRRRGKLRCRSQSLQADLGLVC